MKELSIEEKAKAYDEAIERAKKQLDGAKVFDYKDEQIAHDIRTTTYDIFPELKESENEKIRKALINCYKGDGCLCNNKYRIPYKDVVSWLEKQKTSEEALQYLRENHSSSEMSDFQAAMNIAVAKAYDKGYNDGLEKKIEQNSTWSEEDEYCRHQLIVFCENCMVPDSGAIRCANWLKSLKDRYTWKPSDEQMSALNDVISSRDIKYDVLSELWKDLKKLKG